MNRERLVVVLLILAVALVVGIIGMSLATDRNREAAVAKLRAKASAMSDRLPPALENLKRDGKAEAPSKPEAEAGGPPPADDESLRLFKDLVDRKKALNDDPASKAIMDLYGKPVNEWTEEERNRIAAFLSANRDLVLGVRRLAELGGPVFKPDYSKKFRMELPHLAQLRDLARLLLADAAILARSGDYTGAVDDLSAVNKLSHKLDQEPILISQLVHSALNQMVSSSIGASVRGEDLPPEQFARLIENVSQATNRQAFADSFTGEALLGLGTFEDIRTGETQSYPFADAGWRPILMQVYGSPFARPWLNSDEETYSEFMGRIGDAARLPYFEAKPILDRIDAEVSAMPRTRIMSRQLLPALGRTVLSESRNEMLANMTCIGLAIEQYHGQNGVYPATLDAIAPLLGGTVPTDPLTGQGFIYEPSGGSFALYSGYVPPPPAANKPPQHFSGTDASGHFAWRAQ